MENIYVRLLPLPSHVRAFTLPDSQGDYNVYINEGLSPEQQKMSLEHEKKHIFGGDFSSELTAAEIERQCVTR